jgi:hypothetical protein
MLSKIGNLRKTCRYFGGSRGIFYSWKGAYDQFGEIKTDQQETLP